MIDTAVLVRQPEQAADEAQFNRYHIVSPGNLEEAVRRLSAWQEVRCDVRGQIGVSAPPGLERVRPARAA